MKHCTLQRFSLVPCLEVRTTVRYSFELGTIKKGLYRAETSAVPSHTVRICIYPRLRSQAIWRPCWAAMGWALAMHGPRGYFYALVTQLSISDLRSIVICVEVTIRSVFGGFGS